jgi:hypothetical protein
MTRLQVLNEVVLPALILAVVFLFVSMLGQVYSEHKRNHKGGKK